AGPAGPQGSAGAPGVRGFVARGATVVIAAQAIDQSVAHIVDLPPMDYAVTAEVRFFDTGDPTSRTCRVVSGGVAVLEQQRASNEPLVMSGVVTLGPDVRVTCDNNSF